MSFRDRQSFDLCVDGTEIGVHRFSMFVVGDDVYVVGGNIHMAKLWKNGVEQSLSEGQNFTQVWSVFVSKK